MRKLLIVALALSMLGCTLRFSEFEGTAMWPRTSSSETQEFGLALAALRASCSLAECEALVEEAGVGEEEARRACVLAWLAESSPCKGVPD